MQLYRNGSRDSSRVISYPLVLLKRIIKILQIKKNFKKRSGTNQDIKSGKYSKLQTFIKIIIINKNEFIVMPQTRYEHQST